MMTAGGGTGESMDLGKLLDVIQNADTYTARLESLKAAEAKASEAAERLAMAKNVADALEKAKVTEATAQATLRNARDEANSLVDSAKSEAKKLKDASVSELEGLEMDITSKRRELSDLVDRLAVTKQELLLENSLNQKIKDDSAKVKQEMEFIQSEIRRKRELIETL